VRFHHHVFGTNLLTNSLTKLSSHANLTHFVFFVSQKFVANQIGSISRLCELVCQKVQGRGAAGGGGLAPVVEVVKVVKIGLGQKDPPEKRMEKSLSIVLFWDYLLRADRNMYLLQLKRNFAYWAIMCTIY
jgi:hypothetical protein